MMSRTSLIASDPDLPDRLARRLRHALPGQAVQARFQNELSFGRHFGPAPAHARLAAVMVLLYRREQAWYIPLTLRPARLLVHGGQVSLPGGMIEPGEASSAAALRELDEEIGVPANDVQLLGELSPLYVFASHHRVAPWLAYTEEAPEFIPNRDEVEEVIELPISGLLDERNVQFKMLRHRTLEFFTNCYQWQEHCIWGATSMILAEVASLMSEIDSAG